jgi:hypothetical protein
MRQSGGHMLCQLQFMTRKTAHLKEDKMDVDDQTTVRQGSDKHNDASNVGENHSSKEL